MDFRIFQPWIALSLLFLLDVLSLLGQVGATESSEITANTYQITFYQTDADDWSGMESDFQVILSSIANDFCVTSYATCGFPSNWKTNTSYSFTPSDVVITGIEKKKEKSSLVVSYYISIPSLLQQHSALTLTEFILNRNAADSVTTNAREQLNEKLGHAVIAIGDVSYHPPPNKLLNEVMISVGVLMLVIIIVIAVTLHYYTKRKAKEARREKKFANMKKKNKERIANMEKKASPSHTRVSPAPDPEKNGDAPVPDQQENKSRGASPEHRLLNENNTSQNNNLNNGSTEAYSLNSSPGQFTSQAFKSQEPPRYDDTGYERHNIEPLKVAPYSSKEQMPPSYNQSANRYEIDAVPSRDYPGSEQGAVPSGGYPGSIELGDAPPFQDDKDRRKREKKEKKKKKKKHRRERDADEEENTSKYQNPAYTENQTSATSGDKPDTNRRSKQDTNIPSETNHGAADRYHYESDEGDWGMSTTATRISALSTEL